MAEFVEVMKYKKRMCEFIKNTYERCPGDCELAWGANDKKMFCDEFTKNYPEKSEEIIMNWSKEHPAVTNADKFKEVYGFKPSRHLNCPMQMSSHCLPRRECEDCEYENFWYQEYKEPSKD